MNMPLHDSEATTQLLDRLAHGDATAIELLFERHLPDIKKSVQRRLRPKTGGRFDASDVVQETHHTALRYLNDYVERRPMPFRLWLLKAAQQRVIDLERTHLRSAKRAVDREVPLPDATSMDLARRLIAGNPSPSAVADLREQSRIVRQCLAQLDESPRQILMLRVFDGLSNAEVSAVLELSPDTAKRRFSQALVKLRSLLRSAGLGGGHR